MYDRRVVATTPASGVCHCEVFHMHATPEPQCVMDASIVLDSDSWSSDFGTQEQAVKRLRYSKHFALEVVEPLNKVTPLEFHRTHILCELSTVTVNGLLYYTVHALLQFQCTDMLWLAFPVLSASLSNQTVGVTISTCCKYLNYRRSFTLIFRKITGNPWKTITSIAMRGIVLSVWLNRSS